MGKLSEPIEIGTMELKNKKSATSGKDVLVIDKSAIGAGASGIACGVIRNNYYQPARQALIAHSVTAWGRPWQKKRWARRNFN